MIIGILIALNIGPIKIPFLTMVKSFLGEELPLVMDKILWYYRIPKIFTALLAGGALGVSGLLLQTFFQNPMAGPFVLGIHSGASLGVALFIMAFEFLGIHLAGSTSYLGMNLAAIIGSTLILTLLLLISLRIPNRTLLLVIGLLLGYFSGGIINILIALSDGLKIKTFLLWSMGSFHRLSGVELLMFSLVIIASLIGCLLLVKPLNALLLGDRYASSLGVSTKRIRNAIIIITSILSGTVTAYCGPVAFIGIMAPHIGRMIFKTNDHKILLINTFLISATLAIFGEILATAIPNFQLPLNAVFGMMGAPLIAIMLLKMKREKRL